MPRAERFHKTFGDIASQPIRFAPRPCGGRARERSHCFVRLVFGLQKFFRRLPGAFPAHKSSFIASPACFRLAKVLSLLPLVCFRLAKVFSSLPRRVFGSQKFFHRLPGVFPARKSIFIASPKRFRTAKVLSSLATACLATSCRSEFLQSKNSRDFIRFVPHPCGDFMARERSHRLPRGARRHRAAIHSLCAASVRRFLQTVFENHSA